MRWRACEWTRCGWNARAASAIASSGWSCGRDWSWTTPGSRCWTDPTKRPLCPGRKVATVLAINRLCAPGSELAIEERWYPSTPLDDLLGMEEGKTNDNLLNSPGNAGPR